MSLLLPVMRRSIGSLRLGSSSTTARTLATAVPHQPHAETEDLPSNLIFEDGEIDVTDEVMSMLERDESFAKALRHPPSSDVTFLPVSSLASENPTLPAPSNLAVPLPPKVFQQPLRKDILHRCVVWYLSLLRQGSGSTKTRAEVAKSGRKLYRQKGTGKARVGDAGSGTRRGGGVIHGPKPRDFAQLLPRKVQELGLHVALSSKLRSGLLRVVNDLGEGEWQGTRDARIALCDRSEAASRFAGSEPANALYETETDPERTEASTATSSGAISKFGTPSDLSVLFAYGPSAALPSLEMMWRAVRNIPGVEIQDVSELSAYEVLKSKWTVLDASAVEYLGVRAGQAEVFDLELAEVEDVGNSIESQGRIEEISEQPSSVTPGVLPS